MYQKQSGIKEAKPAENKTALKTFYVLQIYKIAFNMQLCFSFLRHIHIYYNLKIHGTDTIFQA